MLRTTTKLTHRDFRHRIRRVDPHFYRTGNCVNQDARKSRPIGTTLLGFGWAYMVVSLATNRPVIETSLRQGTIDPQYHDWILAGLASLIAISFIMLATHVFRFLFQSGARRTNSGGLLIGCCTALIMIYTPPQVWQAGFQMLDENSQAFIQSASASMDIDMPEVDLSKVSFVSSNGN